MDETGHSGDTGPADGGSGADSRDRTRLNGWATPDSPWSNAGSALDPEEEVPAWRRPSQEIRPFTRQPLPPDHKAPEARPFPDQNQSSEVRPFGSPPNPFSGSRVDRSTPPADGRPPTATPASPATSGRSATPSRSGEVRPFGDDSTSGEVRRPRPASRPPSRIRRPAPRWSDSRTRYCRPAAARPQRRTSRPSRTGADRPAPGPGSTALTRPEPLNRPDSLEDDDRRSVATSTRRRRTARRRIRTRVISTMPGSRSRRRPPSSAPRCRWIGRGRRSRRYARPRPAAAGWTG